MNQNEVKTNPLEGINNKQITSDTVYVCIFNFLSIFDSNKTKKKQINFEMFQFPNLTNNYG